MGESGKNFSVSQNRAIRGLNMGAGFRDYKSRQERLQIMEILGISNRDKKITNRAVIINWCRTLEIIKTYVQVE